MLTLPLDDGAQLFAMLQLFAMVFGLSSVHGIQRDLLFAPSVSEAPCLSHRNLRAAKPTVTLCLCAPDC